MDTSGIFERVRIFEKEAHRIFGKNEASLSRIITLHSSYDKLDELSVQQDDMFRQALRCVELEVFRGAHVMAWAALIDYLQEFSARDKFDAINTARAKWKITRLEDLRERISEYQFVDSLWLAKLITKNEMKAFHGLLTKRNECAHPSDYFPDLNQTLGYVSEVIARLGTHKKRFAKKAGS